jgi:hypothetical protein
MAQAKKSCKVALTRDGRTKEREAMDTVIDQWPWFAAAATVLVVLVVAMVAYSFYKPKPKSDDSIPNQQDGWSPTGRIDFMDRQSSGDFVLQVEDTRIADSTSGVEHREIRWRKATLDEAKRVIVAYHAQRNLARTANFIVTSPSVMRRNSDSQTEHQEVQPGKDEASDRKPES